MQITDSLNNEKSIIFEDIRSQRASLIAQLVKNLPTMQETLVLFLGWEDLLQEGWATQGYPLQYSWVSLVAQLVNNLLAMWETWVQFLGWDDPLEKGKATHSSILGLPCGSAGKEFTRNAGNNCPSLHPRSSPQDQGIPEKNPWDQGEGTGYPLQYSGLENSMDCMVHGVATGCKESQSLSQRGVFRNWLAFRTVVKRTPEQSNNKKTLEQPQKC